MFQNTSTRPAIGAYISFLITGTLVGFISANIFTLSEFFAVDFSYINNIISIIGVGRLVSLFVSGVIADKFGSKKLLLVSMIFISIFYVTLPINSNIHVAFVLSFFAGLGNGMIDASATKLIFDCYPEKSGFAIGLIQLFFCLGASLSPVVAAVLIKQNLYFGWFFWGIALICIINLLHMQITTFPPHKAPESKIEKGLTLNIFTLKNKDFRNALFALGALLTYSIASSVFFLWNVVYAKEIVGLSEAQAIQMPTYFNIGALLSGYTIGKLYDRIHVTTFLIISPTVFLASLFYFITAQPQSQIIAFLIFIIAGFAAGITPSYIVSIMGKIFPDNQGAASGLAMSMLAIGLITTPIFTGLIFNNIGISAVMYFGCLTFVACIILCIICKVKFGKLEI